MAVAVDATRTESIRTDTSDPYTFSYTPTSTPRGIVVCIIHSDNSTDYVVGVTYGGVPLYRAVTAADATTEAGRSYIYWRGDSIPASTQTVSIDLTTGTTDDMQVVVFGLTAGANVELIDTDAVEGNTTNPSVVMSYLGRTCVTISAFYYGGSVAPTPNANMTSLHTHDFTAQFGDVSMQTTPGTADFTCSYTANDDTGLAIASFTEVLPLASLLMAKP